MTLKEFTEEVKEYMGKNVGVGKRPVILPTYKNNATVYQGLIIIDPILNISPTIYLDPYYDRYKQGVSINEILVDILCAYRNNLPTEDFDISVFKNFSKAKKNLVMKIVNTKMNEEMLREVPSVPFHDLSLVFMVNVSDLVEDYATILIHNQHLEMWDVTVDELYAIAMKNTPKVLPCRYERMEDYFERIMENPFPFLADMQMYLVTNQIKIHGATCIAYPGLLKELYNKLGDNLIIIPSSIHEVLVLPEHVIRDKYTLEELNQMVVEANVTQLTKDEVLSNHIYLFDGEGLN